MKSTDPFTPEDKSIVVVSAGLSESASSTRLANHLAQATTSALATAGMVSDVTLIELRPLAVDIMNATTGFAHSQRLDEAFNSVAGADGIITVTPTYKASYSGLFKSFWDIVEDGVIADVPVLLGATGGTARHSLVLDQALFPLFAYMNALVMPRGVFAATDDWGEVSGATDATLTTPLDQRIERAAGAFAHILLGDNTKLPSHKAHTPPTQGTTPTNGDDNYRTVPTRPYPQRGIIPNKKAKQLEVTPFDELLKGHR